MSNFPPIIAYPSDYDSDYTLFLVYNTAEAITTEDVAAWAEEIPVRPRKEDEDEIWANNGYANISGELFYYDSVQKNSDDKVCRLKRSIRNIGGRETQFNEAGTWVRGFVIAEHHNQLVTATLLVENFIGENFTDEVATLDWRIRNLAESPIQGDDFCPEVQFDFEVVSTNPATGTIARYNVNINGAGVFTLQFGDGTSTNIAGAGTHIYAPGATIDPVVVISTDLCQIVQSPITRTNPQTPVAPVINPPFFVPVPVPPQLPPIVIPSIIIPPPTTNIPPVVFPCINGSGIPSIIIIDPPIDINIPSRIDITPIPSKIEIVGPPINVPSRIIGPDIQIPSLITFIGPNSIPITPPPPIPPIQIAPPVIPPINFGPMPKMPSEIGFKSPNIPSQIRIDGVMPSTIQILGAKVPSTIQITGMPSTIKIEGGAKLPSTIKIEGMRIPSTIQIKGNMPSIIQLRSDIGKIPSVLRLKSDIGKIPSTIDVRFKDGGIPSEIHIKGMPKSIDFKGCIPSRIRVEGMPTGLSVVGFPDSIKINGRIPDAISIIGFPEGIGMSLIHNIPETLRIDVLPKVEFDQESIRKVMATISESMFEVVGVNLPKFMTPPEVKVDWGDAPPLKMVVKLAQTKTRMVDDVESEYQEEMDFPTEFKLVAPEMPTLKFDKDTLALAVPNEIKLGGISEIKLVGPAEGVKLAPFKFPKLRFNVKPLKNLSIPVKMPNAKDMPSFKVEFPTEIPKLKVEFPKIMPTLKIEIPDNTRIPLFYDGPAIPIEPVQVNIKIQNLAGEAAQDLPCVSLVPCSRK